MIRTDDMLAVIFPHLYAPDEELVAAMDAGDEEDVPGSSNS